MNNGLKYKPATLLLWRIRFHTTPAVYGGTCSKFVEEMYFAKAERDHFRTTGWSTDVFDIFP